MMLTVLMLFGMVTALFVYGMFDANTLGLRRNQDTATALAQAKDALIGYAVSDATRPGELPCPDVNNDGQLTLGIDYTGGAGSPCVSLLGRLPWKTLGLPDLRDGSGERLWYALSDNFHAGATSMLDNDTKGQLTITGAAPGTYVVAIVFSPGEVLGTQVRDAANENNVANYLEGENANGDTIFTTGAVSATFNDKLLVITTDSLMTPVEQRVAREMLALLKSYRAASACGCYPWAADNFDDDSVTGRTQGMVPIETALPESWGSLGIAVPAWMIGSNEWGKKFYYAIAPSESQDHTVGTITVNGVSKNVVLITPGPAGASRPSTNLPDYVDDAENGDGGTIYITPLSTAYARDRLYTISPGNTIP